MNSQVQQDYEEVREIQLAYPPTERVNVYEIRGLFQGSEGIRQEKIIIMANNLERAVLTANHFGLIEKFPRKMTITNLELYLSKLKNKKG